MESPRIAELRRRVEADPSSIAFAQLAEEHRRAGDLESAERVCRAGLERHPAYASARVTLGRALVQLGRTDEAQREFERVLTIAPDNLAALRAVADIYHRRGELVEALACFERALPLARHDPEIEGIVGRLRHQVNLVKLTAPATDLEEVLDSMGFAGHPAPPIVEALLSPPRADERGGDRRDEPPPCAPMSAAERRMLEELEGWLAALER